MWFFNSRSPTPAAIQPVDPLGRYIEGKISFNPHIPLNSSGGYGDLFLGTHRTFGKVAMKRMRMTNPSQPAAMRPFEEEVDAWRRLQHRYILRFLGIYKHGRVFYMVSPYVDNGSLAEYVKICPETDRPRLLRETADALVYLHNKDLIHGDIKAQNILVTSDVHALLCDFGLARLVSTGTITSLKGAGSHPWRSPELWEGNSKSQKTDVYAFGMTIYQVLSGKIPYEHLLQKNEMVLFRAVTERAERPPRDPESRGEHSYSTLWDVAARCWQAEPDQRPTMLQVLQGLSPERVNRPRPLSSLLTAEKPERLQLPGSRPASMVMDYSAPPPSPTAPTEGFYRRVKRAFGLQAPLTVELQSNIVVAVKDTRPVKMSIGSDVLLGSDISGNPIALKRQRFIDDGSREQRDQIKWEADLWRRLDHEHILEFLGLGKDKDGTIYLASPWMHHGTVRDYLENFPDCDRQKLILETANALIYLHNEQLIHGDIKGWNILVSPEGEARLSGFKLACLATGTPSSTSRFGGSIRWQSPEVLRDAPNSFESDVYAFGMTIYEVLSGNDPFHDFEERGDILTAVLLDGKRPPTTPLRSPIGESYDQLWDVAEKCWVGNPVERPLMANVFYWILGHEGQEEEDQVERVSVPKLLVNGI